MVQRLLGLLLVCYSWLHVSAAAFHRTDEGLKERLDEALNGRNQGRAAKGLVRAFEGGVFDKQGDRGSIRVLLLGVDARAAARAFVGPSTTCYDLTNTSKPLRSSDDIRADIDRLTSRCKQPCEAVIIVEHAELLESGLPLNPLLAVINDESVDATFLVLYESDAWASRDEDQAKAAIAQRLKADWGMKDQFNTDAFVGRFQVVAFAPTREGQPGDLGPICSGPGEVAHPWEAWVEWGTQPRQLLTIAGSVVIVALMHWSISSLGAKKGGAAGPALFPPGGQAPPSGGGRPSSSGGGASASGRRRAPASAPKSPSQDIETPKGRPRGGASRRTSTASVASPTSSDSSAGAEVRRSSRLQKKKGSRDV